MKSGKKGCLLVVLVLAALLLGGGVWLHSRGIGALWTLWRMTEQWAQSKTGDFQVSLEAGELYAEAEGWWTDAADDRVYCLEFQDIPVYIQEETLVLDNGRSYSLPDLPITDEMIRELALGLLLEGEITAQNHAWHVSLPRQGFSITAAAADDRLTRLELRMTAAFSDLNVPLTLVLIPQQAQSHTVPAEILPALDRDDAVSILEPLEPLRPAIAALGERETIAGNLSIALDCGVLTVDDTLQAQYTPSDGTLLLSRGGIQVPVELPELRGSLSGAALPMLLLRNGTFSETADGWQCVVDVEPDVTKALCCALIPELAELDFEFARMEARILIRDGVFRSVTLGGNGEIPFLMTSIPIGLTITWDFA